MPEPMLDELKALANEQDVPYQSLMKVFLAAHEAAGAGLMPMTGRKLVALRRAVLAAARPARSPGSRRSARGDRPASGSLPATARSASLRNAEASADLASEQVGDFDVTRDGLDGAGRGVSPQGVGGALALQHAAVLPEVT